MKRVNIAKMISCHGLDLRTLLEKLPAGLHQTVDETGWQLSQGERSRLFLARA